MNILNNESYLRRSALNLNLSNFVNLCCAGVQATGGQGGDFQDEKAAGRVP